MSKQISNNNIDRIIKNCGYETSTLTYNVGETEVCVEVNPNTKLQKRINTIANGVSLSWIEDMFVEGMVYPAYGYSLLSCFTNIKTDNVDKVIQLVLSTDIVKDVEEKLPNTVLDNFSIDFFDSLDNKKAETNRLNNLDEICGVFVDIINKFGGLISNLNEERVGELLGISTEELEEPTEDNKE